MMQQDIQPATPQQPVQPAAPEATAPATPVAVPQEAQPATLQEFALNLLNDPAAMSAFDLDPEGVLSACGLSDITPGDVQEILPLVLDAASIADVDGLSSYSALTGLANLDAASGFAGDLSGHCDVSSTLDGVTGVAPGLGDVAGLGNITDLGNVTDLSGVTGLADTGDVLGTVTGVTGVADVNGVLGTVTGVTDVVSVDGVPGVLGAVTTDVTTVTDVVHEVVPDIAPVSGVHDTVHSVVDGTVGNGLGGVTDLDLLDGVGGLTEGLGL